MFHFTELPSADTKYAGVKFRDRARVNAILAPYEKLDDSIKEHDPITVCQGPAILADFSVVYFKGVL